MGRINLNIAFCSIALCQTTSINASLKDTNKCFRLEATASLCAAAKELTKLTNPLHRTQLDKLKAAHYATFVKLSCSSFFFSDFDLAAILAPVTEISRKTQVFYHRHALQLVTTHRSKPVA